MFEKKLNEVLGSSIFYFLEGKIEEIKKVIDDFDKSWMHNSHDPTQKMMDDIKKILES